jgi:phosphate transport system protein
MRAVFDQKIITLYGHVGETFQSVQDGLRVAGLALLGCDAVAADRVFEIVEPLARIHAELDDSAVELIACQQPVATDLRTIIATVRMSADLERMGVLMRHIAEVALAWHPECAVPARLRGTVEEMAQAAQRIVAAVGASLFGSELDGALGIDAEDDVMDRLRVRLHKELQSVDAAAAADMALVGRYYERIADHAVSLARGALYRAGRGPLDPAHPEPVR